MEAIPVLDLGDFTNGDPSRVKKFVQALGESFTNTGFVVIKGHSLSEELRLEMYDQINSFFDLSQSQKDAYIAPGLAGQRGYTAFGQEHAKDASTPDLKEFWQFGQKVTKEIEDHPSFPKNIHVEELPMFNPLGMKTFKTLESIGADIMRALALFLNLEEDYFDSHITCGNSILRAIHYPGLSKDPGDALRSSPHEDINLITLLMGASSKGLEILTRENTWLPVVAGEGELVVNIGDMVQRLTNGQLPSTTHRVSNPSGEDFSTSRYSLPFFLHPRPEMPLNVLEQCVSEDRPVQFKNITAGEYLTQRLREIGLIK